MKIKVIALLSLTVLLIGCFKSVPKDNVGFGKVDTVYDLEGIYKNQGESGNDSFTRYLSAIIWPNIENFDHKTIETIEVIAISEKTLKIKANGKSKIIKEDIFIQGKDFEIRNGRIKLNREYLLSLAYPADNPFIGGGYGEDEIGIDERGDGKYKMKAAFAGTAYLFFPIAGGQTDEVRFIRIDK